METKIPICNSCGQPMIEAGKIIVKTFFILYQCPECKDVKLK